MKKAVFLSVISFLLGACGGGGSGSTSDVTPQVKSIDISGVGSTTEINESERFNLTISGTGNDLIIQSDNVIEDLKIPGSGNTVEFKENTTVKSFSVSGTGNTIFVPVDSGITFVDSGTGNALETTTTNSVTGVWEYTYPGTQCVETYTFSADGSFKLTSLDEVAQGTYSFDETVVTGRRHELTIAVTSDNGLADCDGVSDDDTGLNVLAYLNFPSSTAMEWYADATGGSALFVVTKQ